MKKILKKAWSKLQKALEKLRKNSKRKAHKAAIPMSLAQVVFLFISFNISPWNQSEEKDLWKVCQKHFHGSLWAFMFDAIERITDPLQLFFENFSSWRRSNRKKSFMCFSSAQNFQDSSHSKLNKFNFCDLGFYLLMRITYQLS